VLLFAWSPCQIAGDVKFTIPDVGPVRVAAPQPWSYWIVRKGAEPQRVRFP
jgi:hypothetical protein